MWRRDRSPLVRLQRDQRDCLPGLRGHNTRSLGIIRTQNEFSRLYGRKDSWFSASKAVDRDLSIGALFPLATALERMPAVRIARSQRTKSRQLIKTLWLMIESKAMTPLE